MADARLIHCRACGRSCDLDSWTCDPGKGDAYCPHCQSPTSLALVLNPPPEDAFRAEAAALHASVALGGPKEARVEEIRLALEEAYRRGRADCVRNRACEFGRT